MSEERCRQEKMTINELVEKVQELACEAAEIRSQFKRGSNGYHCLNARVQALDEVLGILSEYRDSQQSRKSPIYRYRIESSVQNPRVSGFQGSASRMVFASRETAELQWQALSLDSPTPTLEMWEERLLKRN